MADSVKTTFSADMRPLDKAVKDHYALMRRTATDIERLQQQRERSEVALSRKLQQNAEQTARAQIAAQQRATRDILQELRKIEREEERIAAERARKVRSGVNTAAGYAVGGAVVGGYLAKQALDASVEQARAFRLISAAATEAGQSTAFLAEKNKQFAASVGLSNVAAAETTAQITRLATNAGQTSPGQIDQLLKSFADLGAARGIQGGDLNALIGTILSGQDEGLNRLGIADPGQLYKQYAEGIGKTVEELTQMEKVQAAVNAVLEKSAIFAGAAEARMNSLEGQVAKSAAAWENFTNALSNMLVTSGPVGDFLRTAGGLLQGLSVDLERVNRELAKGKSPEQVTRELYPEPSTGDILTAGVTAPFAAIGRAFRLIDAERFKQVATPQGVYERRFADQVVQTENTKTSTDQQNLSAYFQRVAASKKLYTDEMNRVIKESKELDIKAAKEASEKRIEADKKAHEERKRRLEEQKRLQEQIQKSTESLFDASISRAGQNNPFLAFLGSANREMRSLLETAKVLSPALRKAFVSELQAENRTQLYGLRLDARLDADSLRRQAGEFRQGFRNDLSDPATVQRILDSQMGILGTSRSPYAGGQWFNVRNNGAFNPSNFQLTSARSHLSPQERAIQDQRLLNLAGGLDPALLRPDQREAAVSAFEREATRKLDADQQAIDFYSKMSALISEAGLKVALGSGHLVTIKNEAPGNARVEPGTQATTQNRYGN